MIWFVFAFVGALMQALYYFFSKRFLLKIDSEVLAAGAFLIAGICFGLIAFFAGIPNINADLFLFSGGSAVIGIIGTILTYKALKITDLSLTMPMLAFTPIFTILISSIMLGEFPSIIGLIGIFLGVIGAYVINLSDKNSGFFGPIKSVFQNKGVFLMLIVSFLYAFIPNFDKIVIQNYNVFIGAAFTHFFMGFFFLISSFRKQKSPMKVIFSDFPKILLLGLIAFFSIITINIALTMQIVPYVMSMKRLSILFGVFIGTIFLKEPNKRNRIIGAVIMLIGVILLVFS
ncbi:MAG: EamA family transporter [archaeon]|nr:EamA family transporter [archaeon]